MSPVARHSRGFTLLELIAAVAIFGVLAAMLFQMVKGAIDLWNVGERQRDSTEKAGAILEEIVQDLRMLRADPAPGAAETPVRMLADYGVYDLDGDGVEESLLQRARWVRSLPEERFDARLRRAGEAPAAEGDVLDRAPGGLAEVGFATARAPAKGADPALLTLVRFFRVPLGGQQSLFAPERLDDPRVVVSGGGDGVALASNVLYFGVDFWSRDTLGWQDLPDTPEGPQTVWDSTRGVLVDGDGLNRFLLAKGKDSLADSDDDVFPRRARVTLVLERDEDEAANVRLDGALTAGAQSLRVTDLRPFDGALPPHPYLKVDGEWMRWTEVRAGEIKVVRAQRRTVAVPHATGARVHVGETFERTVEIPVYREDWNDK